MPTHEPKSPFQEEEDQEDVFRLLVDAVRDYAIYMLDAEGYIRSWNAGAQRAKLYTADEIIGKHFSVFYTPEEAAANRPQTLLKLALEQGRIEDEGWRVRKDGTRFWADVILTPIYADGGQLRGFAKVTRDMTEKRQLIIAREEALKASNAKSAFVANLSHELRTPLTGIIGYAEIVADAVDDQQLPEVKSDVDKILFSANHLMNVVNDILDISKIESGEFDLNLEQTEPEEIIHEVLENVKPLANTNRNALRYDRQQQVCHLMTDKTRLRQIMYNLLSNACKFTHDGSITMGLDCLTEAEGSWAVFTIADTGCGMSPDDAALIFERFYQAKHTGGGPTRGGTGLGLAICKMLTEAMGGTIALETELGKGTMFTVKLPLNGPPPRAKGLTERWG